MRPQTTALGLVLLSFAQGGCSTTATVTRSDSTVYEGTPAATSGCETMDIHTVSEGLVNVRRDAIVDIDHPGNVHAAVGAFLLADSVIFAVKGANATDSSGEIPNRLVFNGLALVYGLIAVPLLVHGSAVYVRSMRAAAPTSCQ